MNELKGKRIAILVTDGFEQIELTSPRETLEKAGATCVLIAPRDGEVQGFKHHDKKDKFKVDVTLAKADPAEFDAVLLPGGVINADALRIDKKAQQFVQEMDRAGGPIAVICHGPWLLINAGLMDGRHITSWPTLEVDLRNAGAIWADSECIRDRNWVSSRKPDDLPVFNREIVKLFAAVTPLKLQPQKRDVQEARA
jgi:protease I